jgi:dihydroflavonol-4-reductase
MPAAEEAAPVLVTGGTGFLGNALVERLVADGHAVRALARSDEGAERLAELGAQPVRGDVLKPDTLAPALDGCELAFHVAGENAFCLRDPSPLYHVNVDGSCNVLRAAAAAGVKRLVYTSSAATLGERQGTVGDETTEHRGSFLSHYERSKLEAERAVLELAAATPVEVVCVNPASVQGPGRTGGTATLFLDYVNGKLPAVVDSRLSVVDIADCTEGHVLAAARGVPGERYVLCGATLTVREAVELLGRLSGVERPFRTLPPLLARAAGTAVEGAARLRRRKPPICRELVRTLLHGHAYDGSRATRELGLVYTPIEETLRRTLAWYADQGLVEREAAGLR